ncbi:MAG TPA: DUF4268 domain-containing protein [Kosmotogaceae bacterium]|nr:MAG: hypothetical protein XE05_1217 [Thermotogales bacterium 46_20]HAA86444.1 DUF4268 domain-containing protein [Kosmotogaceae bacterium]
MPVYEIRREMIFLLRQTSFEEAGIKERDDLQRLLKDRIETVSPDTLIISEGFHQWEDSRREIDLLGVDKDANLVVIELKRTKDPGHAELQAIRYAAMVSAMTFEKAVEVYQDYLRACQKEINASESLLEFLEWNEPDEERFAQNVRIVLVAAEFTRELTTSVMWLNQRDLDIRCVRLRPYKDEERIYVDIQQVIPLPEAEDYIIRIREKAVKERQDRAEEEGRRVLRRKFWEGLLERMSSRSKLFSNVSASSDSWIATGCGISSVHYTFSIRKSSSSVQFCFEGEKTSNKVRFDWLHERREKVEKTFGGPIQWKRCDDLKKSYLTIDESIGGYRNDREDWPKIQDWMIDTMIRLEKSIRPYITELRKIVAEEDVNGTEVENLDESEDQINKE